MGIKRRWKVVIIVLLILIVLGFPPAVPWMAEIEVIHDKEIYMRGEPIVASAYLVNDNPFPIRLLPYNKFKADLLGLGDTASNAAHVDWGIFASVYIPAHSRHTLFENSTFHPKDVGIGSLKVDLYSFDGLIAREITPIVVMLDESPLSETCRSAVDAALEYALVQQEIPDYRLLAQRQPIILSSMYLGDYQPEVEGIDLLVLTPYEVQERADQQGDFLYLNFKYINEHSSGHVSVKLDNNWIRARDSTIGYLSGGGFTLDMYRNEDTWDIYQAEAWIS